ncbi:MAG: DUF4922 domain-containing protein [Bacteroidales bacterium]|nr:DUF4922 domain-containing protein [Candidatus Scybalocola fimicaballi]
MSEIQKTVYDKLIPANESLEVLTKTFIVDGYKVVAQHNPARAVSSGAKLDKATIAKRKCFLCAENRPVDQPSVGYNENFEILKNPFPILKKHLTIPLLRHERQEILPHFATMLDLSKDFPDFTLLYNGPKCGASAPDHMHFQASQFGLTPLDEKPLSEFNIVDGEIKNFGRKCYVFEGTDKQTICKQFETLYDKLEIKDDEWEPRMNVVAHYITSTATWNVWVFARDKHRPSYYEQGRMISPGVIDMEGILVFPKPDDFADVDEAMIRQIYKEVSL